MGFSGGVDASFAVAAHADRASLGAYGIETAVVSTNWQQEFCPAWFMSFNTGLTSLLHTFSGWHGSATHATDHDYRYELTQGPYGSNAAINHLLGRPGFPLVSTGGTHRRIERVGVLAEHPLLLDNLRVCYQEGANGANCGHCEKCVRTQLEMRAVGLPTERQFPAAMTESDLDAAHASTPTVIRHFEDILASLSEFDTFHQLVRRWVERERLAHARVAGRPLARVAQLEEKLAAAEAELAGVHASRPWSFTRPLRATTDLGRRAVDAITSR